MPFLHRALLVFLLLISVQAIPFLSHAQSSTDLTIYLFRHAEKTSEGADPGLTVKGMERSKNLLKVINEGRVDHLFSTPYKRTTQTIAPFSDAYKIPVQMYDPRRLARFADSLKTLEGVVLVAGHSNTTPELVHLLSGSPVPPILESEYDNLFIVNCRSVRSKSFTDSSTATDHGESFIVRTDSTSHTRSNEQSLDDANLSTSSCRLIRMRYPPFDS